eukprot:1221538-Pleurochrysis_carterae.AAC.1
MRRHSHLSFLTLSRPVSLCNFLSSTLASTRRRRALDSVTQSTNIGRSAYASRRRARSARHRPCLMLWPNCVKT